MSDRNWEAEMAKIDKQLASVSDDQLLADRKAVTAGTGAAGAKPSAPAAAKSPRASTSGAGGAWSAWLKVVLAIIAAGGLMYWPWPARCGLPVVGFTAATGSVVLLGMWSAFGTWRHRLGLAHLASLLVIGWGVALGAREILPRTGYAIPTVERPGQWSCEGLAPLPPSNVQPNGTPDATPTVPSGPPNGAPNGPPNGQTATEGQIPSPTDVPIGPPPA